MNVIRNRPNPAVSANGVLKAAPSRYAYRVELVHPTTKEPLSNHVFRKNDKTPAPQEAAYKFAQVVASPSIVVKSITRIREPIKF